MKKQNLHWLLVILLSALPVCIFAQQDLTNSFKKQTRVPEKFQTFPLGSIKPTGWLKKQLTENLDGFTGHLDSLAPDLILKDDIYGKDRITKKVKGKNVGAISDAGDWQVQFIWWNSETQSNWWDGLIKTAVLLNDEASIAKIKVYIARILKTQDADGYLGIYDKDLRYHFTDENGELWSKTTLLRGLLSWYEYSKDKVVLDAIQRAVDNVIKNYPAYHSHPFYSVNPYVGGLSHGLVFTDVLEKMYRLTGNIKYLDYGLFLYKDFSEQSLNEDAQLSKLLDTSITLKGHGVHTYEHLRTVAAACFTSGDAEIKKGLDNFLQKISLTTSASGAPIGDEYIGGRKADATETGYEYCSLQELTDSYLSLLIKTGDAAYGDKAETIFYNAANGARHPVNSSICYLKTDNSYSLTGGKNGDTTDKFQSRYRYSPVHREAAVCCVPNAGKIAPTFIQNMWMKQGNALVAALPGPCILNCSLNGADVTIESATNYPFENTINYHVKTTGPVSFAVKIRQPAWCQKITCTESYTIENGYIVINRKWKDNHFSLRFEATPATKQDLKGEYYFSYGALVLAHPLESKEIVSKVYHIAGLKELKYLPDELTVYRYNAAARLKQKEGLIFTTELYNPVSQKNEQVTLVPMGNTILRQVTFKPQ